MAEAEATIRPQTIAGPLPYNFASISPVPLAPIRRASAQPRGAKKGCGKRNANADQGRRCGRIPALAREPRRQKKADGRKAGRGNPGIGQESRICRPEALMGGTDVAQARRTRVQAVYGKGAGEGNKGNDV